MKTKLNSCGGDGGRDQISMISSGSKIEKVKKTKEVEAGEMKEYLNKLQEIVPRMPKNKRLSKLEVISHVIDYIRELRQTLGLPPCENEDDSFQLLPNREIIQHPSKFHSDTIDNPLTTISSPVKSNVTYQNLSPPLQQRQPLCAISSPRNSDLTQLSRDELTSKSDIL